MGPTQVNEAKRWNTRRESLIHPLDSLARHRQQGRPLTHDNEIMFLFDSENFRVSDGFKKTIQALKVAFSFRVTSCRDDANLGVSAH